MPKTFAHIFFVRPDCNIFEGSVVDLDSDLTLTKDVNIFPEFYYAKKHCPELLVQLTQKYFNHEFMMFPSNKAESFSVKDEYINNDSYGQSWTGYKIPYGTIDTESKGVDTFSIKYHDDKNLRIYQMHKLWMDYISYEFRGKVSPKLEYMVNKIIDYATCVYYILTAQDGETIIFWTKYWGVFPIESPSSSFSYTSDNVGGVANPEMSIQYRYAWKEDFNPLSLLEFNMHSTSLGTRYVPSYQKNKLGTGYTWADPPFIETFMNNDDFSAPYTFKLRFRKPTALSSTGK